MRLFISPLLSASLSLLGCLLASAQDQCNLLPVSIQTFPLYSLVPHTLTKTSTTICEKYTPTGTSQYDWIVKLINLAFTGDFKPLPNLWPANPNGTYQSTGLLDEDAVYRDPCFVIDKVNLVKYFNGTFKSNNRNGKVGTPLTSVPPFSLHNPGSTSCPFLSTFSQRQRAPFAP